jgi:hypothetical protein
MPDAENQEEQGEQLDLEYQDPYEGMEFAPFDAVHDAPVATGTPLGTGKDGELDDGKPPVFDERYKQDFEGLMFLGALSSRFSYIGHTFLIKTLTINDLLAASKLTQEYEGTIGAPRAYATAIVALSTVAVDGIGLPSPIGEGADQHQWAHERFDYVAARWYPWVVDYVYDRYLLLEERTRLVLEEMEKKAHGRT